MYIHIHKRRRTCKDRENVGGTWDPIGTARQASPARAGEARLLVRAHLPGGTRAPVWTKSRHNARCTFPFPYA
eukprot:306304-Pyramimonas_sp.AAC.1